MIQKELTLELPNDFLIMCEVAGFHPEHALQYFINQVSYPRLLSIYPIDPNRAVTGYIFQHAKKNLTKKIMNQLQWRYKKGYDALLVDIITNKDNMEQAELEEKARLILYQQRDEIRKLLPELIKDGFKLKIFDYEH